MFNKNMLNNHQNIKNKKSGPYQAALYNINCALLFHFLTICIQLHNFITQLLQPG